MYIDSVQNVFVNDRTINVYSRVNLVSFITRRIRLETY